MSLENEKELNERINNLSDIAHNALNGKHVIEDECNDLRCKLLDAESAANRFKFHMKFMAAVNVVMLVSFVLFVISLTQDPVVCEGEEKAWDKYLIELNACWDEQDFLDYANKFGFCDPRPFEMYTRSCEAVHEINNDFNEYIKDCEEDLLKCNSELDRVEKNFASQYNLNELMRQENGLLRQKCRVITEEVKP